MKISRFVFKIFYRLFYQFPARLNGATTEKERALTAKAIAETHAIRLESFRKNVAALAFAYGLLVVFCYCFFDIKFFPSGLSTGDVLFFLFAALGLGLMSLFCTALGMSAFLPASFYDDCLPKSGAAKEDENFGHALWFFSPIAVIVAVILALWNLWSIPGAALALCTLFGIIWVKGFRLSKSRGREIGWTDVLPYAVGYLIMAPLIFYFILALGKSGWLIAAIFLVAGMAGAMGLTLLDGQVLATPSDAAAREKQGVKLMVAQVMFAISLIPALVIQDLRVAVFMQLGVRTVDTGINLNKANLEILQSAADTAGISLSVCRGEGGQATVAPIDVLWHASGVRSLVHLGGEQGVDVELDTSGLKLVRGKIERCLEIKENLLFGSGKTAFVTDRKEVQLRLNKEMAPLLSEIKKAWQIKSVTVIGHADPMPLPDDGNERLAKGRAAIVKGLLIGNPEFLKAVSAQQIEPVSDGDRRPIKQCDTKESVAYQRSCNAVNRRVEIRFRLERLPKKTDTTQ